MVFCTECGKENPDESKFCYNCGKELGDAKNDSSLFNQIKYWWNKRSKNEKGIIAMPVFFVGFILIIVIPGLIYNATTTNFTIYGAEYDAPGECHIDINDKTTEYVINGVAEEGATITVTSSELGVNNQKVQLNFNTFQYKLKIPANVNEVKVRVDANKAGQDDGHVEITIKRHSSESTSPTSSSENSVDVNLEENVEEGVKTFFKEFNAMYDEDGVNSGYLISTINIDSLNKISDTEVEVTVSLKRIASNGDKFDSKWSGSLYLKDGKWVDDGNFVQTYSYNTNTGEKVSN